MAYVVTDANFASEVLQSSVPVLVDFYADWCGPCQMMAPLLTKLTPEFEGKVKIVKVNVDDSMDIASKYGIQGIPAFKVFQGGKVVEEFVGAKPESSLREILNKYAVSPAPVAGGISPQGGTQSVTAEVLHATETNFDDMVLKSSLPVLVDFYADWCGPCQMMAPLLVKLAKEYEGKYKIVKVNVDHAVNLSSQYEVQGIPAFKVFKGGKVIDEFSGARPEMALKQLMDQYL